MSFNLWTMRDHVTQESLGVHPSLPASHRSFDAANTVQIALGNLFPAFAWALFIYSSMMGRLWLSWTISDFFSYKYKMIPTKDNDAIQNTGAIHDSTTVETRRGTSRAKSLTTSISKQLSRQTWVSLFRLTPTNQPHFEQHWLSNFPKQIPRIFGFQLLCISASSSLWNSQ